MHCLNVYSLCQNQCGGGAGDLCVWSVGNWAVAESLSETWTSRNIKKSVFSGGFVLDVDDGGEGGGDNHSLKKPEQSM